MIVSLIRTVYFFEIQSRKNGHNLSWSWLFEKKFLVAPILSETLRDPITFEAGEVSFSLLHQIHEENKKCQSKSASCSKA